MLDALEVVCESIVIVVVQLLGLVQFCKHGRGRNSYTYHITEVWLGGGEERPKGWVIGYRDCITFFRTGVSQPTQNKPLTLCW